LGIPSAYTTIHASHEHRASAGGEADSLHGVLVAHALRHLLPCSGIVDARALVGAAGGDQRVIRRPSNPGDSFVMAVEGRKCATCGDVPKHRAVVPSS